MRFYHRLIRDLILPSNAGPNDPSRRIGPTIRPGVQALFPVLDPNATVAMNDIWQLDGATYWFDALGTSPTYMTIGRGVVGPLGTAMVDGWRYNHTNGSFGKITRATTWDMISTQINLTTGSDLQYEGDSLPRGIRGSTSSQSNTGAIGTTFTNVMSVVGALQVNRGYVFKINGRMSSSGTTERMITQVRVGGVTVLEFGAFGPEVGANGANVSGELPFNASATGNVTFNLFIRSSSGTINFWGSPTQARTIQIIDVGPSSKQPNAPTI